MPFTPEVSTGEWPWPKASTGWSPTSSHPLPPSAVWPPACATSPSATPATRPWTARASTSETRNINVRGAVRDRAVDAWIAEDTQELEAIWNDVIQSTLGTGWDAYTHVSSIGWAA